MAEDGYRFLSLECGDAEEYVVDKEKSCREFAMYFLIRIMKMFKYEGLPEEIPVDCMSKMLFCNGFAWFTKFEGTNSRGDHTDQFYVFKGRLGDVIDAYYRPTRLIVANPGANCYKDYILDKQKGGTYYGEDGVIIRNDPLYHGLMPLILRYSYLLAENVLTMRTADVFLRILALISAPDDKTVISANEFIRGIEDGKMSAIADGKFFEGVKMQSPPSNNGSYLTQFIEYQQYFLGSFFNEIGLNANFNMKRESIAKSESSLNEDSMLPLCQQMLQCRQEDFAVVNEMYGLNIKVSFDSAWLQNALEIMMEMKQLNSTSQLGGMNGGFGNDQATEEDQGTKGVGGVRKGESGSSGETETAGGEDSDNRGQGSLSSEEGGTGDEGKPEGESEGAEGKSGEAESGQTEEGDNVEELIERAAGLEGTIEHGEESGQSEQNEMQKDASQLAESEDEEDES